MFQKNRHHTRCKYLSNYIISANETKHLYIE